MIEYIKDLDVDVLCVQEVNPNSFAEVRGYTQIPTLCLCFLLYIQVFDLILRLFFIGFRLHG